MKSSYSNIIKAWSLTILIVTAIVVFILLVLKASLAWALIPGAIAGNIVFMVCKNYYNKQSAKG